MAHLLFSEITFDNCFSQKYEYQTQRIISRNIAHWSLIIHRFADEETEAFLVSLLHTLDRRSGA